MTLSLNQRGHLAMSGDILVITTCIQWVDMGMLLNLLQCTGPPTTNNYLAQNVNRATVEKPCIQLDPDSL